MGSTVRKFLLAAVAPALPVIAYYLGVAPDGVTEGAIWYAFIVGEAISFGVYAVPNATS